MKHRTSSLPNPDPKVSQQQPEQLYKSGAGNKSSRQQHNESVLTNKSQLMVDSVIKQYLRGNNKILVRRNKAKFQKNSQSHEKNMRKTMNQLSTRYEGQEINRSSNLTLPQSEKQKFIDILQSKILRQEAQNNIKQETTLKSKVQKQPNQLNQSNFQSKTYRLSMPNNKVNDSVEENRNTHRYSSDKRTQSIGNRAQKLQNRIFTVRSRSRTIGKEQIQIKITPVNKSNDVSRTIELEPGQQKKKMDKNWMEIEKYEKISLAKETKEIQIEPLRISEEKQDQSLNIENLRKRQSSNQQMGSLNIKNSENYENEVNSLTKDFFHEWQRMNFNKSKIYKTLRQKLVAIFPNFKKHYKQFSQSEEFAQMTKIDENFKKQNIEDLMMITNDLNLNRQSEGLRLGQSSIRSGSNPLEVKNFQQKMEEFQQRQQLKDIFKQAYFWSRTKNKSMSTNFLNDQELDKREMIQLKKIQKNLTFMNYIKPKTNKSEILNYKNQIKGENIIKNKDSILQIEKEGTKQQQFLKKCLDNAIQNCMKSYL